MEGTVNEAVRRYLSADQTKSAPQLNDAERRAIDALLEILRSGEDIAPVYLRELDAIRDLLMRLHLHHQPHN